MGKNLLRYTFLIAFVFFKGSFCWAEYKNPWEKKMEESEQRERNTGFGTLSRDRQIGGRLNTEIPNSLGGGAMESRGLETLKDAHVPVVDLNKNQRQ